LTLWRWEVRILHRPPDKETGSLPGFLFGNEG